MSTSLAQRYAGVLKREFTTSPRVERKKGYKRRGKGRGGGRKEREGGRKRKRRKRKRKRRRGESEEERI
jgi:hypothetical protein